MLLKNVMEDKKLNFNQPILSVRRFSSNVASEKDFKRKTVMSVSKISSLPTYKSELKSGPISNVGAVPFVWEQSPGRPKGVSKVQTQASDRPPIAPSLPPGRILKAKQESDNASEDPNVYKRQGKVHDGLHSVSSSDKNLMKFESAKDNMDEESSDSGNGNETYLDALDSLSRTESFFLNCSVTGVSGFDDPEVKPSGTVYTDPQTRDFMMGRFLPAAKAMVLDIPQHPPRKQAVVWQQPREVKKVVSGIKRPPLRYGPNIVPLYVQENVEEDSDDDFNEDGKLAACGLLPRFCIKSRLLNPVPGLSVRTRVPMSPVSRTQTSSSSAGSYSESENEQIRVAAYDQRSVGEPKISDFREDKCVSENGSNSSRSNSHELEGSILYRRLQGNGMSPYCNELPQSHFPEHKENLSIPGEAKNSGVSGYSSRKLGPPSFQELLAVDQNEIDSWSPVVEKTLYVDTVRNVESPKLNSVSPDMKEPLDLREKDFNILARSTGIEENSIDSSVKDMNKLSISNGEAILQSDLKAVHSSLQFSANKSYLEMGMDRVKICGEDDDFYHDCISSVDIKLRDKVQMDFEVGQPPKEENSENSDESFFEFPVPPPLPKTPSDSWLGRTLPSISKKKTHLRPFLGTEMNNGNDAFKPSLKKEQLTTIPEIQ